MRLFTTTALSITLAAMTVGALLPTAASAARRDREEQQQGPQLQPSREFVPGAQAVQELLAANNFEGAKAKLAEIEPTATKPDDKYYLGNFYLSVGSGLHDESLQRKGIELMLSSGKAAEADVGKFEFAAGQLAMNAKDYAAARTHLQAALTAGHNPSSANVFLAESYFGEAYQNVADNQFNPTGQQLALQGLGYLKTAIDLEQNAGNTPDATWYSRGLKMAVLAHDPNQFDWFKLALPHVGSPENWRVVLRSLQDANPGIPRPMDLMILRLMDATNSLSNNYSYSEYAEAAWKEGLPGEVKDVIERGRQRGDIQQTSFADLYQLASQGIAADKASLANSERTAASAANGRSAANTAEAYLGYGDYAKAAQLYKLALQKGGADADETNLGLGIALAKSGDKAGAVAAFGAVSGAGLPRQIADLWTIWVNSPAQAAAPATSGS